MGDLIQFQKYSNKTNKVDKKQPTVPVLAAKTGSTPKWTSYCLAFVVIFSGFFTGYGLAAFVSKHF